MRHDIERLVEILKRTRKYTPAWEWPEKEEKELGVVEELLPGLNALGLVLHNLRVQRPDPPDCVCDDANGKQVGIEVSEVVCEDAARLNAQGHAVYRAWRPGELGVAITTRLGEKDSKTFYGGPFSKIIICLFTDEPELNFDFAKRELASVRFGPYMQISAAYLLFSYEPGRENYPLLPLQIAGDRSDV